MALSQRIAIGIIILLTAWVSNTGATEMNFQNRGFAADGGATSIPVGAYAYCRAQPGDCTSRGPAVDHAELTERLWTQLQAVNNQFNQSIVPVSDRDQYGVDEYWTIPSARGDCEDYVLGKRHDLINDGWSPSTLLIAVVRRPDGEGHAVLIVRTDRGDLVLDNLVGRIDLWSDAPYEFIKRQSQADARKWVSIVPADVLVAVR